jgi:hypothetical protein
MMKEVECLTGAEMPVRRGEDPIDLECSRRLENYASQHTSHPIHMIEYLHSLLPSRSGWW